MFSTFSKRIDRAVAGAWGESTYHRDGLCLDSSFQETIHLPALGLTLHRDLFSVEVREGERIIGRMGNIHGALLMAMNHRGMANNLIIFGWAERRLAGHALRLRAMARDNVVHETANAWNVQLNEAIGDTLDSHGPSATAGTAAPTPYERALQEQTGRTPARVSAPARSAAPTSGVVVDMWQRAADRGRAAPDPDRLARITDMNRRSEGMGHGRQAPLR